MFTWSVKPLWKKSIVERNYFHKGDETFVYETGWRWGEFHVYTEDDEKPDLSPGVDIYSCEYETELVETNDDCWDEYDYDNCSKETKEWLEKFFEEGNSVYEIEEHGWSCGDTEMIIDCDMEITKVEE